MSREFLRSVLADVEALAASMPAVATDTELAAYYQGFLCDLERAVSTPPHSTHFGRLTAKFADGAVRIHLDRTRIEFRTLPDATWSLLGLLHEVLLLGGRVTIPRTDRDRAEVRFLTWGASSLYAGTLSCDLLPIEVDGGELVAGVVSAVDGSLLSIEVPSVGAGHAVAPSAAQIAPVGSTVSVFREPGVSSHGELRLSLVKSLVERAWESFVTEHKVGTLFHGKVMCLVKGGVLVDVGAPAYLPRSRLPQSARADLNALVGKEFTVRLVSVNRKGRQIVVEALDDMTPSSPPAPAAPG